VVESTWRRSLALDDLSRLRGPICEVFCRCDAAVARARIEGRAAGRHPGHHDLFRLGDDLWTGERAEPIAGAWPLVEIDTNGAFAPAPVVAAVRAALAP
jgi:hypothetical protein